MGQKIHPYGFRLGNHKKHHANWFGSKNTYSAQLFEDLFIREYFKKKYKNTGILALHTERQINNHIKIYIFCIKASLLLNTNNENIKAMQKAIRQRLINYQSNFLVNLNFAGQLNPYNQSVHITLKLIELPDYEQNATFIADFLIDQLEKRIAFRRAVKKTFKRTERSKLDGIKIQISGRLNGAEIARTEWVREGRVPLQTLNANIDYCNKTAQTIYGILGIKIWVFVYKKEQIK